MAIRKLRHVLISVVALAVIGGGGGLVGRSIWAVHGRETGDGSNASSSDKASGSDKDSKGSVKAEDKLTFENTKKIKSRTTTYKEIVALLGEPASKDNDKDGKLRSAKWISGEKSFTVNFEDDVVRSTMSHAIPVPDNPKLTQENLAKVKAGTTTFKEVMELLGEPTSKGLTKDGKLGSALWVSGSKTVTIGFEDDVVRSINARGLK